ncbi:hypothetical protein OSTOST_23340 [Ostertagia ostertagi]
MLLGSLMSYGMGSMWGGHSMMMPSYGGGLGMGGGYYSDNDTNITNNYYNTPDPSASGGAAIDAGQSHPAVEDVTNNQDDAFGTDNQPQDDVVDDTDANQDDVADNDYPADDGVVEEADHDQ